MKDLIHIGFLVEPNKRVGKVRLPDTWEWLELEPPHPIPPYVTQLVVPGIGNVTIKERTFDFVDDVLVIRLENQYVFGADSSEPIKNVHEVIKALRGLGARAQRVRG